MARELLFAALSVFLVAIAVPSREGDMLWDQGRVMLDGV
jgi:hypothetical protein